MGGLDNQINSANQPFIGGGFGNLASGTYATIAGGWMCSATATAAIASGFSNNATAGGAAGFRWRQQQLQRAGTPPCWSAAPSIILPLKAPSSVVATITTIPGSIP